jgi:predicted small lipoprotein YifL
MRRYCASSLIAPMPKRTAVDVEPAYSSVRSSPQHQVPRYNERVTGDGPRFREPACKLDLEGVISKRADRPYAPGDRGIWVKSKCLNREDFVVVGWTDPEGSRQHIGALRQPVGRSTLQPSGVEVDVGLRPCSWDSARKCVQNLPFPAPILHTGQLYLPPASSLLMGKQDSRPRADKVNLAHCVVYSWMRFCFPPSST